jgi:hypothetical protein
MGNIYKSGSITSFMEEVSHLINVLEETKEAIVKEDILKLGELSNQTIHSASTNQDAGSITIAVIVYALSKIIERKDTLKIKNWNTFIKKIDGVFTLAVKALKEDKVDKYEKYMEMTRKAITSTSLNIKPYIQDVMRKASINKASKIYEHGISLGQTAEILGITEWELSEYSGQTRVADVPFSISLDIVKRAKMALEFFA